MQWVNNNTLLYFVPKYMPNCPYPINSLDSSAIKVLVLLELVHVVIWGFRANEQKDYDVVSYLVVNM